MHATHLPLARARFEPLLPVDGAGAVSLGGAPVAAVSGGWDAVSILVSRRRVARSHQMMGLMRQCPVSLLVRTDASATSAALSAAAAAAQASFDH